jgi:hypothetical protein
MINSTIVLGGGNAGLMSALYLKASLNSLDISVIKSKKIGTIGVGEGSTEHWTRFASAVGITMVELIEHCGATIKTGIKFENWHGDGTSYFHSLPEWFIYMDGYTGTPHSLMRLIGDGVDSQSLHWPLVLENNIVVEPLTDYYQFHFDSEKLNAYLQELCIKKGITLIDAEIVDCILDNEGFVQSIVDDLQARIGKKIKLPPGYYVTYGGAFENLNAAKKRLGIAVPIALFLIFLLLFFAFNSVKQAALNKLMALGLTEEEALALGK